MILKIDNFTIPDEYIKEYKVDYNKIDGEGTKRNLNGDMRRQVIANKIKISVNTGEYLKEEEVEALLREITKDTARVSFYNPKTKRVDTINAYFNTPSVSPKFKDNNRGWMYSTFSFNIIEL